jgi:Zn-dependent oligopeptidase
MNPLTQKFITKHDTAPFSATKTEDFLPALTDGIEIARQEIDAIVNNPEEPTFKNTIEAMSYSGDVLERASSIFFNLHSAETNDEIQKIAVEVSPLLSEFGNDIRLNAKLFARVKAVYDQKASLDLTPEQTTLIDKKYKSFSRNGANLTEDKKTRLREIDKELSKLSLEFGENVLAETNAYQLHITNEADLLGLPEGTIEAAREIAKGLDKEGWIFTLDHPSYIPFVTYADNRKLRKEIAIAFGARAYQGNEHDNREVVLQIVKLRHERANLLGYSSHADFVLEERMAESPEKVKTFLNDLLAKAKPAAEREFAELTSFAKELDGIEQLEKWDGAYYSEKLKQKLFNLDDEKLKPYFKLENVLNGAFVIAGKLYRLTFKEVQDIDKYHKDVTTYEVIGESCDLVAIFYADFFPRKGKRNGAWMTSYKSQYVKDGINVYSMQLYKAYRNKAVITYFQ